MLNLVDTALPQGGPLPRFSGRWGRNTPLRAHGGLNSAFLLFFCLLSFLLPWSSLADGLAPTPEELATPPETAERLASGLVTQVIVPGTGEEHPDANDLVAVHFIGWTPDGMEFRNSYVADKHGVFNLQQVFPGWAEGIQLMVVGEKRRLWIPEHLGPQNPRGGPPGASVFDVELLGIKPVPNPTTRVDKPLEDAERTAFGAMTKVLKAGEGDVYPDPDSVVLLHYSGWTTDGLIFDSTYPRGRPTAFPLDKIMPAFADAVQLMVVGEKRYVWIPAELAEGQWPGNPKGDLVFEMELIRILPADVLKPSQGGATSEEVPDAAKNG